MSRSRRAVVFAGIVIGMLLLSLPALAALISQEQEVAIGREASQRLEARYPLVRDLGMQERVTRIGQAIAAQGKRGITYHFKVLDMDQVNALAFPGGFIYATRGLMQAMPDEELAFVLGHEVAHVEQRHSVQQMEADLYKQVGLAALLSVLGGGKVSQGTLNTVRVANVVVSSQYSQGHEREADREGMILMAKAGYDPMGAVAALETMRRSSGGGVPGFLNSLVGSHPLPEDRIREARKMAVEIPFSRPAGGPAQAPAPAQAPVAPASSAPAPMFTPVAP